MIKLYVCEISNLINEVQADEVALESYFDKLGKMRIEHILKNNRAEDRVRALGAALLLLFALKESGCEIDKLPDFAFTGKGKPYIKELGNLHFNISHTKNMITCAISDVEVGVDIEHIRAIKDTTVNRVFSEREKKMAEYGQEGYVRFWTIKEACAKLIGTGLADILDGLEIYENNNKRFVKKLNQDIRKTSCYIVVAEGQLYDSYNYPYYYSVCAEQETNLEIVCTKWDKHSIIYS